MILVRDTFRIRFGKIDQAVDHFRRLSEKFPTIFPGLEGTRFELMTDISGPMYTVYDYSIFPSIQAWEDGLQVLFASAGFQDWFKDWKQYVEDGSREFFHIERDNEGWSSPGALIVRSCFRALEWRVHDAVALLTDHGALLADAGVAVRHRVLTDASGRMFNVVQEVETTDLGTWEEHRRTMFSNPTFQSWFRRLLTCVSSGTNEFYTLAAMSSIKAKGG
ncbi:MAG: hypothetical protein A2Y93_00270 [Chloroflexi bacterium RBG_13_68_17]|jgi:hypothetical protein|nr:MAG: hypothetical protein A2Y93_00270 [Chloroflexi bacterium RBG_13_68_17]